LEVAHRSYVTHEITESSFVAIKSPQLRVLLAGIAPAVFEMRDMLAGEFCVEVATTLDEALRVVEAVSPQVLIVGYHFDQFRPYRLIQQVAADHPDTRIVLVRAISLAMPHEDDEAIREAYGAMGVSEYLVLASAHGASIRDELCAAITGIC